jgi:hypothetical protein
MAVLKARKFGANTSPHCPTVLPSNQFSIPHPTFNGGLKFLPMEKKTESQMPMDVF